MIEAHSGKGKQKSPKPAKYGAISHGQRDKWRDKWRHCLLTAVDSTIPESALKIYDRPE
jgi:hypothetical protein